MTSNAISIGRKSSPYHQFLAFVFYMANESDVYHAEEDTRVTINGKDVELIEVDWKPMKALYPFARYIEMNQRNLDLMMLPDNIDPYVYHGLLSQNLLNFKGYLELGLRWNEDFEMGLATFGAEAIRKTLIRFGDYIVSKRLAFMKFTDGHVLCTYLVEVSLKPEAPVMPFPTGCSYLMSQKLMNAGIYAVIFHFNTIPNPFDTVIHLRRGHEAKPVSTCAANLIGTSDTGECCMITRLDSLSEEPQEISFDLELSEEELKEF